MKYCRYLLIGVLALVVSGCGQTVKESLKQPLVKKSTAGADKTVVILPFADYSYADDLETAFRRSLLINENLTDQLVANSFHLPVQEDVFMYLVNQKIIKLVGYKKTNTSLLEDEIASGEWSPAMQDELRYFVDLGKKRGRNNKEVLESPGTHGLTQQEIVKIGRHFGADYILRGRIIEYKTRQDPSWAPWKKGVLSFVSGASSRIAFGTASADTYDKWGNMIAGAAWGGLIGSGVHWPYDPGRADQTIFGVSGGRTGNTLVWGAVGSGLGKLTQKSGVIPQAVVQLRIWVQDAYTGEVVWTNRVDVKVSPESVLADQQYDALFEAATEKAVDTLVRNFVTQAML